MTRTPEHLLETSCSLLTRVREEAPLVQCLTNAVVTGFTANVLLAVGASPAMVDIPEEAGAFAPAAGGVLINLGTPHAEQRSAMREAAASARTSGTPWVLDPVAIGHLPVRTPLAHELAGMRPSIVRANASEVLALTGSGGGGRGTDSASGVEEALPPARAWAARTGAVVAVSGAEDAVTDGVDTVRIANGDPLLTRVTGGGCALGAVIAAFAAVADDAFAAAVAGVLVYAVAAELAATQAAGPGSFAVALLDRLADVDAQTVRARAVLR